MAAWIDEHRAEINEINRKIWTYAETGLQETRSSAELKSFLARNGFKIQDGVAGMPTAFVASYGSGKPVIGILAEYDALPGLSQKAEPRRAARPEADAGHGCGHSLFGTASSTAAVAVRQWMERNKIAGTIRLYGTPAEEALVGKIYMLRAGLFDDADIVLTWHVWDTTNTAFEYTKAMVSVKFTFRGLPAHASVSPHEGRSSLDAVELMNVGANYLREHIKEDARMHYVITDGGGQPNVVPPRAQVWYYLRANKHTDVEQYFERLKDIARGAALMTGTTMEMHVESDAHEMLPNRPLAMLVDRNLRQVGAPQFDDAEREFARQSQSDLRSKPAKALSDSISPLPGEPTQGPASTDVGSVSWKVPTGALQVAAYAAGAPAHSWQIVAAGGMSIGEKALAVAAKTLAFTAADLLASPGEIESAKRDFEQRTRGVPFRSLLPEGQQAPKALR